MKNETPQTPPVISHSPKTVKRHTARKNILRLMGERNNNGTFKSSERRQMMTTWNDQVIFFPRRKKLKGYQKNNH